MRNILILLFLSFASSLFGQNYYYYVNNGMPEGLDPFIKSPNIILNGPTKDIPEGMMSEKQTLPFSWNFYGQEVTEYYACDKGYISFSDNMIAKNNIDLPNDVAAPKNAIFALWDDLSFYTGWPDAQNKNGAIVNYTYGQAPNRTHVIQWVRAVSGDYFRIFSILIHESGDFDIHHSWGGPTDKGSATIGVQNADGTLGFQLDGSPKIQLPSQDGSPENSIWIQFKYGEQPTKDLAAVGANLPELLKINTASLNAQFSLLNYGSEAVTSFDLNLQINDEPVQTKPITGVNIAPYKTYLANLNTFDFKQTEGGKILDIKMWATNINGGEDMNPENDEFMHQMVTILGVTAPKNAFLEDFTGAWCPNCPRGHKIFKQIKEANPDRVVLVAHHVGDVMETTVSKEIADAYTPSYPNLATDRTFWPDKGSVAFFDPGDNSWNNKSVARLNAPAPVEVDLKDISFNSQTRDVSVTVTAKIVDYLRLGDINLNLFVLEDNVTGGSDYDQKDGANVLKGYVHRDVMRGAPSGTWGENSVIPENYEIDNVYEKTYTFKLGTGINEQEVLLVGFVSLFNENIARHEVFNAKETHLIPVSTEELHAGLKSESLISRVYPNPSKGLSFVEINLAEKTEVTVEVLNQLGQIVSTLTQNTFTPGAHTVYFDTSNVSSGVYTIKVSTPQGFDTQKVIVTE